MGAAPLGDAIVLPAARMLCDTPDCGHVEDVPPRAVREYLGAKCPTCSAVMVTEETVKQVEAMLAGIDLINRGIGPVESTGEGIHISARVDRAGDIAEASFRKVKP